MLYRSKIKTKTLSLKKTVTIIIKDTKSAGIYCLPRLHKIVMSVATANIMAPHVVPKQNQNKNIVIKEDCDHNHQRYK